MKAEGFSGPASRSVLAPRLALFLGVAAVSSGSLFVRLAQQQAPSLTIAAYRLGLSACLVLGPTCLRRRREIAALRGADWLWILAAGAFLALHFGTWITSLEYTSVASSVALVSTSPLWVALFAWIAWREPLTRSLLAGLGLALAGSMLVCYAEARTAISPSPFLGNVLALVGALAVSGYWLIGRKLRCRVPLLPYITLVYGAAAVLLLAAAWSAGQKLGGFRPAAYAWFLLLALFPQLLGHSSFNWALAHLPASLVAIATLGEPVGAALLAALFLAETPSPLKIAAAAMVLAGIYLALRRRRGRSAP